MPNRKRTIPKDQAGHIFHDAFISGIVSYTNHALKEMEEDGIDAVDLSNLAMNGAVYDPPEPHIQTGNNIYRMESKCLGIIAAFQILDVKSNSIRIVTTFRKDT